MIADVRLEHQHKKKQLLPAVQFMLWLFMLSTGMLFISMTSAYVLRRAEGNWDIFELPQIFTWSTAIIILSSISMHWAMRSAAKDELGQLKAALWATMALGIGFMVSQWLAWTALTEANHYFVGNPAGTFIYILSGLHIVHIIGGVIFLAVTINSAHNFRVHSKNMLRINMCTTYWHYLDALWVYLFLFLTLFR